MRSKGWGPNLIGLIPLQEREETPENALSTHMCREGSLPHDRKRGLPRTYSQVHLNLEDHFVCDLQIAPDLAIGSPINLTSVNFLNCPCHF